MVIPQKETHVKGKVAEMLNFLVVLALYIAFALFFGYNDGKREKTQRNNRIEGVERMTTAEVIQRRRRELGLTLEQVGEAMGVDKSTVRKWEKGIVANMRRDKIARLAEVLQIEPMALIAPEESEAEARLRDWRTSLYIAYERAPEYTRRAICDMLKIEYLETEGE